MSEKKVIASISGGKDSLAALMTHIESGGRCDGAIYCRIMFDEKISAEYPEGSNGHRRGESLAASTSHTVFSIFGGKEAEKLRKEGLREFARIRGAAL